MKIQVTCPNCRSRLAFENQPGIESKIIKCPKCEHMATVAEFQRVAPKPQPPTPPATPEGDTQIALPSPTNTDAGQLHVKESDQFVSLKRGKQIVGRLAKSKVADIQIGSNEPGAAPLDKTMSRLHVVINVEFDATGNLRHVLSEHPDKPANGTIVNGKKIGHTDQVILHFGDVITLGNTHVVLEPTDEEATKILV